MAGEKPISGYTQLTEFITGLRILVQRTGVTTLNHIELDTVLNGLIRYESDVVNNVTTSSPGLVLDARQGKVLKDLIDAIVASEGVADGIATLGSDGKVTASQIPSLALVDVYTVASEAEMLACGAEQGDMAIRTDENMIYILATAPATTLGNWVELTVLQDLIQSYIDTEASARASGDSALDTRLTAAEGEIDNIQTEQASQQTEIDANESQLSAMENLFTALTNPLDIKPVLNLDFASRKVLDPRITFNRASTGRYYDGKTYVKAEENLISDSVGFTNFANADATVITGQTAPDGSTDAILVTNLGSGRFTSPLNKNMGEGFIRSIWAKVSTEDVTAGHTDVCLTAFYANTPSTLVTLTDEFVRYDFEVTSGSYLDYFYAIDFRHASTTATDVYLWAPQLEQRDSVTAYTPTTGQPITNYQPVMQEASADVARFDHDPVTGESLGLLLEEQRTNLHTYSEDFSDASWSKLRASIDSNVIVSPSGELTMDKFVASTDTGAHYINQYNSLTSGNTYTKTVFAKYGGYVLQMIGSASVFGGPAYANFDLENGVVTAEVGGTAKIYDLGNGIYRCSFTVTATSTASGGIIIGLVNSTSATRLPSWTGDGFSGVYIWGAQLEAESFPTSYIKTESSQVTRSADSASMTGTNFSDWYRQGTGSVYIEASTFRDPTIGTPLYTISDDTLNNYICGFARNIRHLKIVSGGTLQADIDAGEYIIDVFTKNAGAWNVDDFAVCLDGGTEGTDAGGIVPVTVDKLYIGQYVTEGIGYLNGHIKKLAYYNQRLSNSELQGLTA